MLDLQPLTSQDAATIATWFENDPDGQQVLDAYQNIDQVLQLLNLNSRWIWMVRNDNMPVGFLDLEKNSDNTGAFALYIARSERQKGLGKQVVALAIQKAKSLRLNTLRANVAENDSAGQKIMLANGFNPGGRDKDNYLQYILPL